MAITIDPKSWAGASERDKMLARSGKDMMSAAGKEIIDKASAESVLDLVGLKSFAEEITKDPAKYLDFLTGSADKIVDFLITRVTGLDVPDGLMQRAINAGTETDVRRELGSLLMRFLDGNLNLEEVKKGFADREPGTGERDSMQRLIGTALRLQVGDILMDWVTQAVPFGLAQGLKDVAERFDKAMNLDDALEDIIQVPMQAVIERGLEQYYNRQLKPQDFTESEARNALLQERISKDVYDKVLDNQGVRDDIRDTLLQMAAPDLTESDIDGAYQHNLLEENEVREHYKEKGFQGKNRDIKVALVKGTRRWKLEEKIFELYGNLYRDGVATKQEVTPFLEHYGFESDEVDMWFQVQELERRQRKWLTNTEVKAAMKAGRMTFRDAIDYNVIQGMTVDDATRIFFEEVIEEAIRKLPKEVRDQCAEILKPEAVLSKLLQEMLTLSGFGLLTDAKTVNLIKCVLEKLGI